MMHPDADLARRMNVEMANRLSTALSHLVGDVLARPERVDAPDPCPAAYGLQGLMRDRALAGDLDGVAALWDRLRSALEPRPRADIVHPLAAPWCSAPEVEILQECFADDVGLTARLLVPPVEATEEATATIGAVLACMARDCPAWHDEFRALVRQVVLASAPGEAQTFAGASAFDLWGAILVNPAYRRDPLHLAMTLIHESSHLKLFHAYLDDEVVRNDPDETYSSPLRRQPRPMNGLYHAAFVLARMACFGSDLLAADRAGDLLGAGWREQVRAEVQAAAEHFDSAHDIIARHGRLTERGAAIVAEAADAVAATRQVAQAA